MKTLHDLRLWLGFALIALTGCAPQALYFHESTKTSFSAAYTSSDSEPLSTSFGYKRRIVAIVPSKDRIPLNGERGGEENDGEALSTISKFYVQAGAKEGLLIRNNFATGLAARYLLGEPVRAAVGVAGLMHGTAVPIDAAGHVVDIATGEIETNANGNPKTVNDVAAERVARIKAKMIGGGGSAAHDARLDARISKVLFRKNGATWIRETFADGRVEERPLRKASPPEKPKPDPEKPKPEPEKPEPTPPPQEGVNRTPDAEVFFDPATKKTMKRITKPDGTVEVVPFKR